MRHRKNKRRLGRKKSHRKATLKSLACALLSKESIKTTRIKAKEAQPFVDRLISIAKKNLPESKRMVFASLRDKDIIKVLFDDVAPRFKERNGGYTRVIPLYPRRGDSASMAILELVEKRPKPAKPTAKKVKEKKPLPRAEERPKAEEKPKIAPEPKADMKEEMRKEKARGEEKKVKKRGFFKNLRKYFRGKAP